ncbi:MAG: hypothetical protein ACXQT4_03275, partial [Methanotrichaceae archaeon]
SFNCDTDGIVKYRFAHVNSPPRVHNGPEITKWNITGKVTPARGVLQAFPELNNLYKFTYTVEFENISEDEELWVELLVKTPNSNWKTAGERKQCNPSKKSVSWNIKPFSDVEFLGTAEYKFRVNGDDSKVFEGPEILAMYKDVNFKKVTPEIFNYMANVTGSANLTVDLYHSTDNENWVNVGDEKSYTAGTGWNKLIWEKKPGYAYYDIDIRFEEGGET